jgi:hypothetical protein
MTHWAIQQSMLHDLGWYDLQSISEKGNLNSFKVPSTVI